MKRKVLPLAVMAAAAALALSCGGDDDSTGTKDNTAPAAITDLTVTEVTATSATLTWTAPGDDGITGTATAYDLRYSTNPITEANWDEATAVTGEPAPQAAGTSQTMDVTISALRSHTTVAASSAAVNVVYYFALKTADEAENWSELSNVASGEAADVIAPAAITDLVITKTTISSVTLSWTATGDDDATGTATTYDIRYSMSGINEANWDLATSVAAEPAPQPAGSQESMDVTPVLPGLDGLIGEYTAVAGDRWYFAIKAGDEAGNWSALSNVVSWQLADVIAPAAITDLAIAAVTSSSMTLSWTATGDDDLTGTAASYDIRYSTSLINEGNWDLATSVAGEPTPQVAGSSESMEVTPALAASEGFTGETVSALATTWYFAIRAADEEDNQSALSNVVSGELDEPVIPAVVSDLACTDSIGESMTLTWTAPGNDGNTGTAAVYDLRYATEPITVETWDAATPVTGVPAPQAAGSSETLMFEDLTWWQTYHWALKTQSDAGDWSGISNVPRATPLPPEDWMLLLRTNDGILSYGFNGGLDVFTGGNYPVETVGRRVFVSNWVLGIVEYAADRTQVATTPAPEHAGYEDFIPIPGSRFALMANAADSVWVIDAAGSLLASEGILEAPDQSLQSLDGVVVDNTLIICEDGHNNLLQMDCDTYAISLFKDLTSLVGWIGRVDYYRNRYYLTQARRVYTFTATGDPELIYEFPLGVNNLTGLAVAGGHAFVCLNAAGALYRVNIDTGEAVLIQDGLNEPQDLALLRD